MSATISLTKDSGCSAQAIAGDSAPHLVATLTREHKLRGKLTITGTVGGTGPLNGLKFSWAANIGGTHVDRVEDADFNTATARFDATQNAYQTATGGKFQIDFDFTGIGELKIYASAAAASTLALEVAQS